MDEPPPPDDPVDFGIAGLLHAWSGGDDQALNRLIPMVYDELRRLAGRHLRHERVGHTLHATDLVHEAFLRLARESHGSPSRTHFFASASQLMRRILVEHARRRGAAKRGAAATLESLDSLRDDAPHGPDVAGNDASLGIVELDLALQRLEQLDELQARVVELRFFLGLSVTQTAEILQTSPATVKREWSAARAWLLRAMNSHTAKGEDA